MLADSSRQLLVKITGKKPERSFGISFFELSDEREQLLLIFRLHRLTAKHGKTRNEGIFEGCKYFLGNLLGKRISVIERPRFRIKAILASVAATAHKEGGSYSLSVGNVTFFNSSVIHYAAPQFL